MDRQITLYHVPQTRSLGVLALLEELGAPYELAVLNRQGDDAAKAAAFLDVNPLGKVPAITDGDAVVTEQVAIFLHLADRFRDAGLAPPLDAPKRGPYLRWMVFYAASFEPAVVDRASGHEPGNRAMSPYGSYDGVMDAVTAALRPGPYLLGETFSAADILWGIALSWTVGFKIVPPRPEFTAYIERVLARPALRRAFEKDAALKAAQTG